MKPFSEVSPLLLNSSGRKQLADFYSKTLLEDVLPFWFPATVDRKHGGFFTACDRDGRLLQTDKSVWFQGRITWMLSTLFSTIEPQHEWLEWAASGIEFLEKHCFDTDGRMFFWVTADGRGLRKRRYFFSETFAAIALAAYGIAANDQARCRASLELLRRIMRGMNEPGPFPPKMEPDVRQMKGLAVPMILMVTAQEVRKALDDPFCTELIDRCAAEIERDFMNHDFKCVLENVGPGGEFYDTFEGRLLNPGHSIEAAWFILEEARLRGGDANLERVGLQILDWSFETGWDKEYGGILYHADARGWPVSEYPADMKFWWPHNETIIATLMAWQLTGQRKYAEWHQMTHDWTFRYFPDREHGEWFGYLHRDGSVSTRLKGNMWKGFFHLPRMLWKCSQLLRAAEP